MKQHHYMKEQDLELHDISLQLVVMAMTLPSKSLRHTYLTPGSEEVLCWSFTQSILIALYVFLLNYIYICFMVRAEV